MRARFTMLCRPDLGVPRDLGVAVAREELVPAGLGFGNNSPSDSESAPATIPVGARFPTPPRPTRCVPLAFNVRNGFVGLSAIGGGTKSNDTSHIDNIKWIVKQHTFVLFGYGT